MDCARIDLIAYHFATGTEPEREIVEKHLLTCTRCLEGYLALKRHVEGGARGERPGDAVRARLRRDVEREFPGPARRRARSPLAWLGRPIPLYQGLAAATIALLVAALAPVVARHATAGPLRSGDSVDTSRRSAESLTIY